MNYKKHKNEKLEKFKWINTNMNKKKLKQVWMLLMIWRVYQDGGGFQCYWKTLLLLWNMIAYEWKLVKEEPMTFV